MPNLNVSRLRFETEINSIASFPKKTVVVIYMYNGLFQKKSKQGGGGGGEVWVEDMEFPVLLKSIWKFQGSSKKGVKFSSNQKIKSHGISMGLGFWSWNFQGVQHNFVEFLRVKLCFLQNFKGYIDEPKNSTPIWTLLYSSLLDIQQVQKQKEHFVAVLRISPLLTRCHFHSKHQYFHCRN